MQNSNETQRVQFLLATLILLLIFILGLALLVAVFPVALSPEATVQPSITQTRRPTRTPTFTSTYTLTPTVTRTPRPTFTPTISLTPSNTPLPTITPTPTALASLTPALPLPFAANYDLRAWNADQADYMAHLLEDYPRSLSATARGKDDAGYYRAFSLAEFGLREALLRYPDASQATEWRWRLAYALALQGDPLAGQQYADLIAEALSSETTDLSRLYLWFQEQEPRLALYMVQTIPPAGYTASYLVEVRGSGSAFFWLLQNGAGAFQARLLASQFDFVHTSSASWIVAELDRNLANGNEVAIFFTTPREHFWLDPPYVFNLAQSPPSVLTFTPPYDLFQVGLEFENRWVVSPGDEDNRDIAFQNKLFPACPVEVTRTYHWTGAYFEFASQQYKMERVPFQAGSVLPSLAYCGLLVDTAVKNWGPTGAVSLMEALLPDWPPPQDELGRPMPLDARDEWLYRLGVYHALLGNQESARHYFNQVVKTPSLPASRWIAPAQSFLQAYNQPQDVYKACVEASYCDAGYALEYLVDHTPEATDALPYLRQMGVQITSSAYFDFDGDGEDERWLILRHRPGERLEFWVLAKYDQRFKVLRVANVDSNPPSLLYLEEQYVRDDARIYLPGAFLEGKLAFSLRRMPDTRLPYILRIPLRSEYPNRFVEGLASAESDLLAGVNPLEVRDRLVALAQNPGLICENTWSCDPYYYLLGLASELGGDSSAAIQSYHRLWRDYSHSPYTQMARVKLMGASFVSPTPTPPATATQTSVPTLTLSPTPTLSLTPTITGTPPTATMTPTATSSFTPTVTGTITPATPSSTVTPTPTGTVTPTTNVSPGTPTVTGTATSTSTSTGTVTTTP